MKTFILTTLLVVNSYSLFAADKDILWECSSKEIGMEGVINGHYRSEYSLEVHRVIATNVKGTFLIQSGINDLNNQGIFEVALTWTAKETVTGKNLIYTNVKNPKNQVIISIDKHTASYKGIDLEFVENVECEQNPY